jgi:penicillin-binding protein 1C
MGGVVVIPLSQDNFKCIQLRKELHGIMKNFMKTIRQNRIIAISSIITATALLLFIWKTCSDLFPLPASLTPSSDDVEKIRVLDCNNIPLTVTYQNRWNIHDIVPLYEIPEFIQKAFIVSEDKRFYSHHGVDWTARLHALWQNGKSLAEVRGASTITEQVVRMWHPRPRSIWSRWLEGIEASRMEKRFSKADIFAFYLNQVPYASRRRGIAQAARYYFDRDLDTLSRKEIMALVVMVRSPSRLDIHKNQKVIEKSIATLAGLIGKQGIVENSELSRILKEEIQIRHSEFSVDAGPFVDYLFRTKSSNLLPVKGQVNTTLDASLQSLVKTILDNRIKDLARSGIDNGAVIITDNRTHEVLAWVNSGKRADETPGSWIDAASTPRQPGSTLKPFAYALALEKGWTAATLIDDSPLAEPVGVGLHSYHNYSRVHYGLLTLRSALGNSLNVPAVRTLQFVGVENFLACLHQLGMNSLQQSPDFYGDGMVLGNGEITLYELVQAYATLANRGVYYPLKILLNEKTGADNIHKVFSPEAASLVGNILSDPGARRLEFGAGGLLSFPVQTAVKTGTSSDYRDAWAIGYNNQYTVGIWMGNLDREAMDGITGSKGPAMVLRSVFAELNRNRETEPLYLSPGLYKMDICIDTGRPADGKCKSFAEWFIPGATNYTGAKAQIEEGPISLLQPSPGLQLAMDPRIPDEKEAFPFKVSGMPKGTMVDWYVDNDLMATTSGDSYLWPVARGAHTAMAKVRSISKGKMLETKSVSFLVK